MSVFLFFERYQLILEQQQVKLLLKTTETLILLKLHKLQSSFNKPMNVFLSSGKYLLLSASRKAKLHKLAPLKLKLKILLVASYPLLCSFCLLNNHIIPVINIIPKNKTNKKKAVILTSIISFSKGLSSFAYSFNKSPRYVNTSKNKTPNPLLISLSSSYLKSFITKIKSVYVSAFFAKTVQMLMQKYQIKLQNHQLKVSSKFHHSFFLHLSKSIKTL